MHTTHACMWCKVVHCDVLCFFAMLFYTVICCTVTYVFCCDLCCVCCDLYWLWFVLCRVCVMRCVLFCYSCCVVLYSPRWCCCVMPALPCVVVCCDLCWLCCVTLWYVVLYFTMLCCVVISCLTYDMKSCVDCAVLLRTGICCAAICCDVWIFVCFCMFLCVCRVWEGVWLPSHSPSLCVPMCVYVYVCACMCAVYMLFVCVCVWVWLPSQLPSLRVCPRVSLCVRLCVHVMCLFVCLCVGLWLHVCEFVIPLPPSLCMRLSSNEIALIKNIPITFFTSYYSNRCVAIPMLQ